jgi:hypothetical protein
LRTKLFACTLVALGVAYGQRGGFREPGVRLLDAEPGPPGQIVRGAPYSAEVSSEITQTLADGNKIHQVVTERLYRDNEGRTRREPSLSALASNSSNVPQLAFIDDPVSGTRYVLDIGKRTAAKLPFRMPPPNGRPPANAPASNSKTESLGRQVISGLPADGTRTTQTIPAGQIGNTMPLQIVTERWYSPDLRAVILQKRSDPRFGESIYEWTNISRTEPPASLFVAPADFQVSQGPEPRARRRTQPKARTSAARRSRGPQGAVLASRFHQSGSARAQINIV